MKPLARLLLALIILILMAIGSLSGDTHVLEGLEKPDAIEVNDKYLYIVDGWQIKIFDRKSFKYISSFGRRGEGPGEFKGFIIAYAYPDQIFVNTPGRISYFDSQGRFLKQKTAQYVFGRFKPFGKGFVGYSYTREAGKRIEAVTLYDGELKKKRELYRRFHIVTKQRKVNLVEERPPFFFTFENEVYVDGTDGKIRVFDLNGKVSRVLSPKIDSIPFTSAHKRKFEHQLKTNPETREYYMNRRQSFIYPDRFPPIRMFHVRQGKIYIMTYKENQSGNEFIVTDTSGKELHRTYIPVAGFETGGIVINYHIFDNTLYLLSDNDDSESWEIMRFYFSPSRSK